MAMRATVRGKKLWDSLPVKTLRRVSVGRLQAGRQLLTGWNPSQC